MSAMKAAVRVAFAAVLLGGAAGARPAWPADREIVIKANAIEPHYFRATMGQRVTFVNQAGLPVHVEFGVDPKQHHVVQVPGTGPIWAEFHRPGTHPYVVHVYATKTTTTLHGVVEVVEDPQRPWKPGTCPAVVMGDCIEP
jgi:plastocyanin